MHSRAKAEKNHDYSMKAVLWRMKRESVRWGM